MGVDELGVSEMGVDEMGSRRSGNKPKKETGLFPQSYCFIPSVQSVNSLFLSSLTH